MKILLLCENYIPHYGGVEVVFKNLAEGYVKQGHSVSLLTQRLKRTKKREIIGGVNVKRVFSFFSRYLFTFFSLPQAILWARKNDLIQTTTFNGAFPAWLAGRLTKKPVVITVHEVWVGRWPTITHFSPLKCAVHDFLERMIYNLPFDKYVCVSKSTKKNLLTLDIPEKKIEVIHNGLDYEFWDPAKVNTKQMTDLRKELGLNEKLIYFSWGRPGESKGFEYAIQAVPVIAEEKPNAVFLLMLSSIDKYQQKYQQLMEQINNLKLKDNIKVIPSVPYTELRKYIKTADCIVVPSLAEGFGYTTVETTAMGRPVVVSNAGSLPEVVSGRYQIFESRNHLDLAEKVIKIARGEYQEKKVKRFEWERSVERYLKEYKKLIN